MLYSLYRWRIFCGALLTAWLIPITTTAQQPASTSANKPRASATAKTNTPEQDRRQLIAILQKRFPALAVDDWSQGTQAISPTLLVTPLGGANATNVNDILAIGQKQWLRKFSNSKTFADCFAAKNKSKGESKFAATTYPQYDESTGVIITIEMALQRCLTSNGEAAMGVATKNEQRQMGALIAYFRHLSVGQKLAVKVASPGALARYQSGRDWFSRRLGDKDKACASCHVLSAGQTIDGLTYAPAVGQVLAWPRMVYGVAPDTSLRRLQQQFQRCMLRIGAEPFALNSPEYNDLEYFLSAMSNGLTLRPPIRTESANIVSQPDPSAEKREQNAP